MSKVVARSEHPELALRCGLAMQDVAKRQNTILRIGLHTGPAIGGLMGKNQRQTFDLFGETVEVAELIKRTCVPNRIHVSRETYLRIHDVFEFEERLDLNLRYKHAGKMQTYMLIKERSILLARKSTFTAPRMK